MSEGSRVKRMLVLGIGSRLMRDDGIGPKLIDALQKEPYPDNWLFCAAETDIAYAMDLRLPGDRIVLLDAVKTGGPPGTVYVVEMETGKRNGLYASLHEPDAWREVFNEPHSGACLIGVEAAEICPGIGLSEELEHAFSEIYQRVKAQFEEIAQGNV